MNHTRHPVAILALITLLLLSLSMAACGQTPTPAPTLTSTRQPAGTLRPTFTATTLPQAKEEATPTTRSSEASGQATEIPDGDTVQTGTPSLTPPEHTPTPAATQAGGPLPQLSGILFFPLFDAAAQTYHIYRLDLVTGEREHFIEQASQPAVTSDGTRIAWRSWKADQRGLLSRMIDGTEIWQMIRFNEAARPDWAPDGERFTFPSRQELDRESRLYLFTGVGDEPFIEIQRHGSPVLGRTPAFLPDGRIVYQGCLENACGLILMDANGTNPQQLTNYADDTAPAISPDGATIAYMSYGSGHWQVNVVNTDGSGQRRLTDDWYWNGLPVWSPDGQNLIFVSTRDENWPDNFVLPENAQFRLWLMDADGENQRPLTDFAFRLDGIPAGVPEHEAWGWIEERLVWLAGE